MDFTIDIVVIVHVKCALLEVLQRVEKQQLWQRPV